jgi:hypothetical protein
LCGAGRKPNRLKPVLLGPHHVFKKNAREGSRARLSNAANPIQLKSGETPDYAFAAALNPFTAMLKRDL